MIKEVEFCDKCKNIEVIEDEGKERKCCLCEKKLCGHCSCNVNNPSNLKINTLICCYECKEILQARYIKIYNKIQPEFSRMIKVEFDKALDKLKEEKMNKKKCQKK